MLKKLRNIGILVFAWLILGSPVYTQAAGIESALPSNGQETGSSFENYEIPIQNLDKGEIKPQESFTDQEKIDTTVNVGAKTLDVSRIRELLIGLVISCGILIFCGIQKSDWYRKI